MGLTFFALPWLHIQSVKEDNNSLLALKGLTEPFLYVSVRKISI